MHGETLKYYVYSFTFLFLRLYEYIAWS